MSAPSKNEVIRARESIEQSVTKLEIFATHLTNQGVHDEAQAIATAVKKLKQSLARIRVDEDGKIVTVQ